MLHGRLWCGRAGASGDSAAGLSLASSRATAQPGTDQEGPGWGRLGPVLSAARDRVPFKP